MKKLIARFWKEDSGALSFEWVTLNSVLVLGVVGGVASVRDAINDEMADLTEAMTSLDQSYVIQPPAAVNVGWTRQNNFAGNFQTQIDDGGGYSSAAWNEFLSNHPGYAVPNRGSIGRYFTGTPRALAQRSSGGTGSLFLDSKPQVDRGGVDPALGPAMQDQSGMIDNNP